ncbi:hypothetical protein LSAT2_003156 [Lamellibrachia satsuma]|nr:hypothetical protein LSAT2_003156 [Lamellibrachia satsuma]
MNFLLGHMRNDIRNAFRLPDVSTAPEQHRRWLVNLWCEGFKPTKLSNICSAHFEDSFINRTDQIVQSSPGSRATQCHFNSSLAARLKCTEGEATVHYRKLGESVVYECVYDYRGFNPAPLAWWGPAVGSANVVQSFHPSSNFTADNPDFVVVPTGNAYYGKTLTFNASATLNGSRHVCIMTKDGRPMNCTPRALTLSDDEECQKPGHPAAVFKRYGKQT